MSKKQYRSWKFKRTIEDITPGLWRYPVRIYDAKGRLKEELKSGEAHKENLRKKFGIKIN